jgi:hypothetical protein
MDADAHLRAADQAADQIRHWKEQIRLEEEQSRIRIENFKTEIDKETRNRQDHISQAEKLQEEEEKRKNADRLRRVVSGMTEENQ